MATNSDYINYILEQLSNLPEIRSRQMMGEYIIYYREKIVAYACDNRLLVKPVNKAKELLPNAPLESPYDGAKKMLLVENTDDRDFLCNLFESIYDELPFVKRKKHKTNK